MDHINERRRIRQGKESRRSENIGSKTKEKRTSSSSKTCRISINDGMKLNVLVNPALTEANRSMVNPALTGAS
jgi:hypothetical protein